MNLNANGSGVKKFCSSLILSLSGFPFADADDSQDNNKRAVIAKHSDNYCQQVT